MQRELPPAAVCARQSLSFSGYPGRHPIDRRVRWCSAVALLVKRRTRRFGYGTGGSGGGVTGGTGSGGKGGGSGGTGSETVSVTWVVRARQPLVPVTTSA